MKTAIFALAMVALVPIAVAPNVNAEVVNAECTAAVALVDGGSLSESFTMTSCGIAMGWLIVRNPTTQTVVWTVTTDLASTTCTWPPDAGSTCSTPGAVPSSAGELVTIQIQSSAGNVVGNFRPSAPL